MPVVAILIGFLLLSSSSECLVTHSIRLRHATASFLYSTPNAEDETKSAFESIFNDLKFGYERPLERTTVISEGRTIRQPQSGMYTESQRALCYPQENRLRGCQALYDNSSGTDLRNLKLQSLPCVTDGSCPYSQFRCSKGHVWKGIIGSPVCFHCPSCESPRKVYGRKREATTDRLMKSLSLYAANSGNTLLSTTLIGGNKWGSTVSMRCQKGHDWTGTVGNILLNKIGCYQCAMKKKRHGEEEMNFTARHFGGKFLGFVDGDSVEEHISLKDDVDTSTSVSLRVRRALWQCAEGHVFDEIAGNIRRPPRGKRKCSWCKACRRNGAEFEWNPSTTGSRVASEITVDATV